MPSPPRLGRRALAAGLAAACAGCSPASILNATVPTGGVRVVRDVPYGDGKRQRLDIYQPEAPAPPGGYPVAVFIYGGNWRTGERGTYPFVGQALAQRDVLTVIPDYRLFPEVPFPGFVEDCARATAWALAHAAEHGGDPRRVFVVGHSAGAFNAAMVGLNPAFLRAAGSSRDRLAGVVGLAGPYDFLPIRDQDVREVFASVDGGPASQPITYADGRNPPMLLLAGADDTTVNPRNTLSLAARIRQFGGPVESRVYPNLGHIGLITAVTPLFRRRAPVLDDVVGFIKGTPPRQEPLAERS